MRRRAITLLEMLVSLAALGVGLTLLAEAALWSVGERERTALRQDALEAAANVLEAARAGPAEGLDAAWAARQALPPALAARMTDGRLAVTVEPAADAPRVKRVTVALHWKNADGRAARPVRLVGEFAPRSAAGPAGGKP